MFAPHLSPYSLMEYLQSKFGENNVRRADDGLICVWVIKAKDIMALMAHGFTHKAEWDDLAGKAYVR